MRSTTIYDKYELVVGLEIHAQLSTQTKIFCADSAAFGAQPNRNISAVSLGHPGTLPKLNERVVEYAVKLGLATNGAINKYNAFDRKNYFYADLPKGYQISQDAKPISVGGYVEIGLKDGSRTHINLHHIHMEEDAGKSMHDQDPFNSYIDLNRAGIPLLEIVSEPDIRSSEQAAQYLTEMRKLLRYLDICDGNMEEGSMRCDANISVRLKGATEYGTRCEVKNMNSIKNVQRAIEFEFKRQVEVIEAGGIIIQNTLNFDANTGETSVLRTKEMANDYRYFPEPDLLPVVLTDAYIENVKAGLPQLPEKLIQKYTSTFGLSVYDATVLTENRQFAEYFEELIKHTSNYKAAANWMMGALKSYLNDKVIEIYEFVVKPNQIAALINLIDGGKVNNSVAAQKIFPLLIENPEKEVELLAQELGVLIETNDDDVLGFIDEVLSKYPEKVREYHKGKKNLVGLFMGDVMKLSKGKIDPKSANKLVIERLERYK
ncbi:Asp-tRNA(Asn)/Glu-tRNA(Gln) amidotransferase subunit GatB [Solitalea lacus]|uniref:Asp-tRNA(Asn)/Glu-tRNA(Gln) amidotransferase subunit GatB n=1 Tax=Solitalea lacus TaxID=2911172 RepID=UPI001EDAAA6C|nr:Asp-tRNA(Asn)/Glu-tRNA(Gln) amidotransferase subunit GatB [Solitalea lacus]UKJ05818.1 Asp-tRNA(Asn)/Glu-tRNA(Gln) amidotransferase subunit GatB [Solitalea lacus]